MTTTVARWGVLVPGTPRPAFVDPQQQRETMNQQNPIQISDAELWDLFATNVTEAVSQGLLDHKIKEIARACFDRRDHIKKADPEEVMHQHEGRHNTTPPFYHHARDTAPTFSSGPEDEPSKAAAPKTRKRTVKGATGARPKRSRGYSQMSTFRHTNGNLYNRSDVIGTVLPYDSNSYIKIKGVGPRACKVVFCAADGTEATVVTQVPPKYRVTEKGVDKIKDPIFMSLPIIDPIIARLTKVSE